MHDSLKYMHGYAVIFCHVMSDTCMSNIELTAVKECRRTNEDNTSTTHSIHIFVGYISHTYKKKKKKSIVV